MRLHILFQPGLPRYKFDSDVANTVLYWHSYDDRDHYNNGGIHSRFTTLDLRNYIHLNKSRVREKTLQLLSQLSTIHVNSKPIYQALALDKYFSLLWPSPLGEYCNISKSPWINDLVFLSAIYWYVKDFPIQLVQTHGASPSRQVQLEQLLYDGNLLFTHHNSAAGDLRSLFSINLFRLKRTADFTFQLALRPVAALVWSLRFLRSSSALTNLRSSVSSTDSTSSEPKTVNLFIDYFCYTRPNIKTTKNVTPVFWGNLLHKLADENISFDIIHHYVPSISPSPSECASFVNCLHSSLSTCSKQSFFESNLSPKLLIKVLYIWIKTIPSRLIVALALYNASVPAARLALKEFLLWSFGTGSLKIILYYNLYLSTLNKTYPSSTHLRAIYLQENLDLEYALLAALRSMPNAECIGYPHSIVRHWDLRYFHPPVQLSAPGTRSLLRYIPDKVLLNGPLNTLELVRWYNNLTCFTQVEATRFDELVHDAHPNNRASDQAKSEFAILAVLGIQSSYNYQLINAIITSVEMLSIKYPVCQFLLGIKMHPQCPFEVLPSSLYTLKIHLEATPIVRATCNYDVAVIDSNTSAVIDTLSCHLPSISYLGTRLVDLSPSSSLTDVPVAINPDSLQLALESIFLDATVPLSFRFFNSSMSYEAWLRLLRN